MKLERSFRLPQPERREPNWSNAEVLYFTTREQHQRHERQKQLTNEGILAQRYLAMIPQLLQRTDLTMTPDTRRSFEQFIDYLKAYHKTIRWQLAPTKASDEPLLSRLPEGARQQRLSLTEPEDSLAEEENLQRIEQVMSTVKGREVLSLSDSHVTTAYMLKGLELEHADVSKVGVLSFDHHTDLRPAQGVAKKENVMAYLLETVGVRAVAVVGYDQAFPLRVPLKLRDQQLDIISGRELYNNGQPKLNIFLENMRQVMAGWKDRGIEQVYTTVDLDGLRLTEQLYSATDYNPLDGVRGMLDIPDNHPLYEKLANHATDLSTKQARELLDWLKSMLTSHRLDAYHGIPASWVTRAMQMAKTEFGLQVGVSRPGTEQRLVGDIVEYTPPDYKGRTARIASALLGGMVATAQG